MCHFVGASVLKIHPFKKHGGGEMSFFRMSRTIKDQQIPVTTFSREERRKSCCFPQNIFIIWIHINQRKVKQKPTTGIWKCRLYCRSKNVFHLEMNWVLSIKVGNSSEGPLCHRKCPLTSYYLLCLGTECSKQTKARYYWN